MGMTAAGALVAIMTVIDLARERSHGAVFIAALSAALSAITAAAVVGVALNLAIWFVIDTIFRQTIPVRALALSLDAPSLARVDLWALLLSVVAAITIFGSRSAWSRRSVPAARPASAYLVGVTA
jgi:hypothetical protein